ncbi:hypothetical protein B7939_00950 [Eggerthia catenaformis]|nr:hypothetical protein B7939_00950 [Eggerthia catenaformis]
MSKKKNWVNPELKFGIPKPRGHGNGIGAHMTEEEKKENNKYLEKKYLKMGILKEGEHLEDFYVDADGIVYLDRKIKKSG